MKICYFLYVFIKFCFLGCDWWKVIIGLDNGLHSGNKPLSEPLMIQFTVQRGTYVALGGDVLNFLFQTNT